MFKTSVAKHGLMLTSLILGFSAFAQAQSTHPTTPTSIAAAQALPNDSHVTLEGVLTKKIKHEHYELKDASGTIVVDIDDKRWPHGKAANIGQKIRVWGEVDTHRYRAKDIDVDKVEIIH